MKEAVGKRLYEEIWIRYLGNLLHSLLPQPNCRHTCHTSRHWLILVLRHVEHNSYTADWGWYLNQLGARGCVHHVPEG
jgi:hypothetical protein